jgi:hypothetical protein
MKVSSSLLRWSKSPRRRGAAAVTALALMSVARMASGGAPAQNAETSSEVLAARAEFERGTEFVQHARWAEALAAFERAHAVRPHAVTLYNIGACQRAMGMYTLARESLRAAMGDGALDAAGAPTRLPKPLLEQAVALAGEMETLLAHVEFTIADAGGEGWLCAIDGRPLREAAPREWIAGVKAPGLPERVPNRFAVTLNPGHHVVVLSRDGFESALIDISVAPGERRAESIAPTRLPATLRIRASEPAIVTINGKDVGPTPVELRRPPGTYLVVLERERFARYTATLEARAGKPVDLVATLVPETTPLTKRWWFWTGLGVLVAGAAVTTYFVTRPEPTRPPVSGGGLGWAVPIGESP